MDKAGLGPFSWLVLAMFAAAGLCSCGSSNSTGSLNNPPPVPQTKHVAVADSADHRILIYDAPLTSASSATTVIGQASLTGGLHNQGDAKASAASLYYPQGVTLDPEGNLWVADKGNCRVLEYKPPFTTGMSASVVIGQPDFESTGPYPGFGCNPANSLSPASLEAPVSVAFDGKGDLWVADSFAGRITEYVPPFSNGMAASLVIGQTDLQSAYPCNGANFGDGAPNAPPTAATLCSPEGMTFDSHGDLWVADEWNLRVLEFVPPFATGMSASVVLGKQSADYFAPFNACVGSASVFCDADGVVFDRDGNLWVSIFADDRALEFSPPFSTGMSATVAIGQPNLTQTGGYAGMKLFAPAGIAFDSDGNLIVTELTNILVYAPPLNTGMSPGTELLSKPNCGDGPTYTPPGPGPNEFCQPVGVVAF